MTIEREHNVNGFGRFYRVRSEGDFHLIPVATVHQAEQHG
jgi:hypothetical protein